LSKFDDLIGKRYEQNGRGPETFDCYGICMEVCKRIGINLPEFRSLLNEARLFKKVEKPVMGDLILMNTNEHHVGVMVSSNEMIHTSSQFGSVNKIKINHPWVQQRVSGYYRWTTRS